MTNRAGIPLRFEVFSQNIGTAGRCQPNGVVPSVISRKATDAEMRAKMSAEHSVRGVRPEWPRGHHLCGEYQICLFKFITINCSDQRNSVMRSSKARPSGVFDLILSHRAPCIGRAHR